MTKQVLDVDQSLADKAFVKAYFAHLDKFTMDELREYVSVVTDATHARLEQIAKQNQERFERY